MIPANPLLNPCAVECPKKCANPFARVVVWLASRGGSRVWWELDPAFDAAGPYHFSIEYGTQPDNDSDGWGSTGIPTVDGYTALDPARRAYGEELDGYYRVKLVAASATYYSDPVGANGVLKRRDWTIVREMVRKMALDLRRKGQKCWILKVRAGGIACPVCLDALTQEVLRPRCPTCYGTGFACGYFQPLGCAWVKIEPASHRAELDSGQMRGSVDDVIQQASMLAFPPLADGDIIVLDTTDRRYFVRRVRNTAEDRGVAVMCAPELRLIPYSNIAYEIPVPGRLDRGDG